MDSSSFFRQTRVSNMPIIVLLLQAPKNHLAAQIFIRIGFKIITHQWWSEQESHDNFREILRINARDFYWTTIWESVVASHLSDDLLFKFSNVKSQNLGMIWQNSVSFELFWRNVVCETIFEWTKCSGSSKSFIWIMFHFISQNYWMWCRCVEEVHS